MTGASTDRSIVAARWATLALAAMPVLGMRPMVAVIAGWLAVVAWHFVRHPRRPSPSQIRWTLLFGAGFLLMLLDLTRATELAVAWAIVERGAALLLLPVGFLALCAPVDLRTRQQATDVFSVSALLLGLFGYGHLIWSGPSPQFADHGLDAYALRNSFALYTGVHGTYAAYFLYLGALFQAVSILDHREGRGWRSVLFTLLVIMGAVLAARMPTMAFLAALVAMWWTGLPAARALMATVVALAVMAALTMFVPSLRERAAQVWTSEWEVPTTRPINSVNVRIGITYCAVGLLEEHPIAGMGLASVQPAMDACQQGLSPVYADEQYDTHCQPLHWWLAFGLPGLAAFLALFLLPLRLAWRERDTTYVVFLVFLLLCSLTENLLARQWGVVLFAGMNALLFATRRQRTG